MSIFSRIKRHWFTKPAQQPQRAAYRKLAPEVQDLVNFLDSEGIGHGELVTIQHPLIDGRDCYTDHSRVFIETHSNLAYIIEQLDEAYLNTGSVQPRYDEAVALHTGNPEQPVLYAGVWGYDRIQQLSPQA